MNISIPLSYVFFKYEAIAYVAEQTDWKQMGTVSLTLPDEQSLPATVKLTI